MKSASVVSLVLVSLILSSFLLHHAIAGSPTTYDPSKINDLPLISILLATDVLTFLSFIILHETNWFIVIPLLSLSLSGFFFSFGGWVCLFYIEGLCDSKCGVRCLNAGVKDRCLKYCGLCCQQCTCVPSGTYGNKSECPCYRDKLNSKGKPKCPWLFFPFIFPPLKFSIQVFCFFPFSFFLIKSSTSY